LAVISASWNFLRRTKIRWLIQLSATADGVYVRTCPFGMGAWMTP